MFFAFAPWVVFSSFAFLLFTCAFFFPFDQLHQKFVYLFDLLCHSELFVDPLPSIFVFYFVSMDVICGISFCFL